jgi:hypothetical protein
MLFYPILLLKLHNRIENMIINKVVSYITNYNITTAMGSILISKVYDFEFIKYFKRNVLKRRFN